MSTTDPVETLDLTDDRPQHNEYEDPGVEWLDRIPAHWETIRLRFLLETSPSKTEIRDLPDTAEVSFVPMESVRENGGLDLSETKEIEEVVDGYTYFRDGDVLVAKITPCFENRKGALASDLTNGIGFGTTELHVLRPGSDLDERFLYYVTMSHPFRKIGESTMYGAGGQKRVSKDFVENLRWPVPSPSEQSAIATYLDRETERIDALIEKKERLIELLKEKRKSLISRVVTKGLNRDVEMQDSGVEWLGEIPAHWKTRKVKYAASVRRGKFTHRPRNDPELYDGKYPFIQTGDIANTDKFLTSFSQTLNEDGLSVSEMFPKGTLVMTIAANIGDLAILNFDSCFPDSIVSLYPFEDVRKEYLYYVMTAMREEFERMSIKNAQMNLNVERISNTRIGVPHIEDQRRIARMLDEETDRISRLVSKVEDGIRRLKEYRTALISAAVTGQIDVRKEVGTTPIE